MITVLDLAEQDTSLVRETPISRMGPCPNYFRGKCSSDTDGFYVKWDADTGKWVFACRGCWDPGETLRTDAEARKVSQFKRAGDKRGMGNDYNYLQHFRDMSPREIYAYREEQEGGSTPDPSRGRPLAHVYESENKNESPDWQAMAHKWILEYEAALWSHEGEAALDYIRSRGLYDETLKDAHVGYSTAKGVPRLLFPSVNAGRIATIYQRNLLPNCEVRWEVPKDVRTKELYRADCLKVKRPTLLLESPPDALSVVQECGNEMCNTVATGGTDGARSIANLAKLALQPVVFVAFDADKAGDKAASWWLDRLSNNAQRLRPLCKDVNDMLTDGWDIRAWVGQAIARAEREREEAALAKNKYLETVLSFYPDMDTAEFLALPEDQQRELAEVDTNNYCEVCLQVAPYSLAGVDYCAEHHPDRIALVQFAGQVAQSTQLEVKGIHHVSEWPRIKAQMIAEMREQYARQDKEQQERDSARLVAAHNKKMKRYSQQKDVQQNTLLGA